MSWSVVARKDFQDAIRSRWLLGLTALFVFLVSVAAYIVRPAPGKTASSDVILSLISGPVVTTLVPLIALVIAYNAVTGERETGSIKLLLSLPHSRLDFVVGKVVGRAGALAVPVIVGFVLPAVVLAIGPYDFAPGTYVGYTLMVAGLGSVFVAIAVGFSAAMPSQRLALAGAFALYFVFVPLWGALQFPLQMALMGGTPGWLPLTAGQTMDLLTVINPNAGFKLLSNAFLSGELFAGQGASIQVSALSMLVFWLVVPPLVGYLVFDRRDL